MPSIPHEHANPGHTKPDECSSAASSEQGSGMFPKKICEEFSQDVNCIWMNMPMAMQKKVIMWQFSLAALTFLTMDEGRTQKCLSV